MKFAKIYFFLIFILFIMTFAPVVASAFSELLQSENVRLVQQFIPYSIFLDQDLKQWAQPQLESAKEAELTQVIANYLKQDTLSKIDKANLGNLYLLTSELELAEKYLTEAFDEGNLEQRTLEPLLYLYSQRGEWIALARITRSWQAEGYPIQPLYFALGAGEIIRGRVEEAENYLRQSLRIGSHGPTLFLLSQISLQKGQAELFLAYMKELALLEEEQSIVNLFLALAQGVSGNFTESYNLFKNLPTLTDLPMTYYLLYLEVLTALNPAEALKAWQAIADKSEDVLLNIAYCYWQTDQSVQGKDVLRVANLKSPPALAMEYHLVPADDLERKIQLLLDLKAEIGATVEIYQELALLKEKTNAELEALSIWKGLAEVMEDPTYPEERARMIREEQGFLWWVIRGAWVQARELQLYQGNLPAKPFVADETLYTKDKTVILQGDAAAETYWLSLDGLNWHFHSNALNFIRSEIASKTADTYLHIYDTQAEAYFTQQVLFDNQKPVGSVRLADGNNYTNKLDLELELTASDPKSGVAYFRIREGRDFWSPWQEYQTRQEFTLLAGADGERKIEVQYQDKAGNISDVYALIVQLDRQKPVLTELRFGEIDFNSVEIRIKSNKPVQIELAYTPLAGGALRRAHHLDYKTEHLIILDNLRENTNYNLSVTLIDHAGNKREIEGYNFSTRRSVLPPEGKAILAKGASHTNSPLIEIEFDISYQGTTDIYYSLSNDGQSWLSWRLLTDQAVLWELQDQDGLKTVYYRFRDENYNISATQKAEIILDTEPSQLEFVSSKASYDRIQLIWISGELTYAQVSLYDEKGFITERIIDEWGTEHSVTFSNLSAHTVYEVEIIATDQAGNKTVLGPLALKTKERPLNLALLAKGAQITASSSYLPTEDRYKPFLAIDENFETYWQAAFAAETSAPQWLELRLAQDQVINEARIIVPRRAPLGDFQLAIYQNREWVTIFDYRNGNLLKGEEIGVFKHEYITYNLGFAPQEVQRIRLVILSGGDDLRIFLPQISSWEIYLIDQNEGG